MDTVRPEGGVVAELPHLEGAASVPGETQAHVAEAADS